MRQNKKGVSQELIEDIKQRPAKTTIVWFEEEGDLSLSLYKVLTKSRGDHVVLLLSTYQGLETLGVTKDDGHKKSAMYKFYDFTKDSYQEMSTDSFKFDSTPYQAPTGHGSSDLPLLSSLS